MRYLLDTNILSELVKPNPAHRVVTWVSSHPTLDYFVSVLTFGEIVRGTQSMAAGKRRTDLEDWVVHELPKQFLGRVLPVDTEVASEWGRLTAAASSLGRPLPVIDGLLLATAGVHAMTFVTRNASDCKGRGVPVIDPWRQKQD